MSLGKEEQATFTPYDLKERSLRFEKQAMINRLQGQNSLAMKNYNRAAMAEYRALTLLKDCFPEERGQSAVRVALLLIKGCNFTTLEGISRILHRDPGLPTGAKLDVVNLVNSYLYRVTR